MVPSSWKANSISVSPSAPISSISMLVQPQICCPQLWLLLAKRHPSIRFCRSVTGTGLFCARLLPRSSALTPRQTVDRRPRLLCTLSRAPLSSNRFTSPTTPTFTPPSITPLAWDNSSAPISRYCPTTNTFPSPTMGGRRPLSPVECPLSGPPANLALP